MNINLPEPEIENSLLAPLAIFAYRRPDKLKTLLDSVQKCYEAHLSTVYIFLDYSKTGADDDVFKRMLNLINNLKGFRKVEIKIREEHYGLSRNIVSGINEVLANHNKIIVLEDDLIVSNRFLEYHNYALEKYLTNLNVFHISGHCDSLHRQIQQPYFFTRKMDCWGWSTWTDRWDKYSKDPEHLLHNSSPEFIREFDFDNTYKLWNQVEQNSIGEIDTWAVFWQATINRNLGVCLSPNKPFAINRGLDGTGEHGVWSNEKERLNSRFDPSMLPTVVLDSTDKVVALAQNSTIFNKINRYIAGYFHLLVISLRKKIRIFFSKSHLN
jgi:hypothetical protein